MRISDQVYRDLKKRIIHNELTGPVLEAELSERLNISRTPLREAIARLVAENWIDDGQGRTKIIRTVSLKEVKDIFQIRGDIEIMVLRLSWSNQSLDIYRALKTMIENALRQEDIYSMMLADQKLHEQIIDDCHNQILSDMLGFIYERLSMLRYSQQRNDSIIYSSEEHIAICNAIIARDLDLAVEQVKTHVSNSYQRIINLL